MSRDVLPRAVEAPDAWETVQIDPATRCLAEQAAAAAALSVEEWLERAIRRACPSADFGAPLNIPAMPVALRICAAPVVPPLLAEHGDEARAVAPAPKRKSAKHLAPFIAAFALAVAAGAATAQYLIPGHARAPAATSTLAASGSEASAASATAADAAKAAAAEAPTPTRAEPTTAASDAISPRSGEDDAAPTDPKALAPWLEQRAENGDAVAQYRLGVLYALGEGVQQDYQHAAQLFKTSAENGVAEAQYNIGVMYGNGLGIGRDPVQAARWYQKAAVRGNANAAFNLGVAYSSGVGVARSMDQAAQWFRHAAAAGVVNAQFNLGVLYERGDGVPVSQVEAYAWYSAAAARGDSGAEIRRDHLASTLGPATLKEAQARAQQIAATIKTRGKSVGGLATDAVSKAAAPAP